jgi:tRNA (guanine-N7-)-methyltransferase
MANENPYKSKILAYQEFIFPAEQAKSVRGQWNKTVFQNDRRLKVEIGSGYGEFMMDYARSGVEANFVGIDFRVKRSFFLARKLEALRSEGINHFDFRFLALNAIHLKDYFALNEISELFYFFPDPWPKKRHHRRRLFQKSFLIELYPLLQDDAIFWVKTDDDNYFEWMLEELNKVEDLFAIKFQTADLRGPNLEISTCNDAAFLLAYKTRFESEFMAQGKTIKALKLLKK